MKYAEKLKDPRWQKKRLEVLERDGFMCQWCCDTETTLHVHHFSYGKNPWDVSADSLITYCKHCHFIVEQEKDTEDDCLCGIYKIDMTGGGYLYVAERFQAFNMYRLPKGADELVFYKSISKSVVQFLAMKLGLRPVNPIK